MQWNINNNYIFKKSKITATAVDLKSNVPHYVCPKTRRPGVFTAGWTWHMTVKNHKSASLPRNLVTVVHRDHKCGLNVSVWAMPDCGLTGAQFLESDGLTESYLNSCSNHMLDFSPAHFFGVTHCERYTSEKALDEQTRCSKTTSPAELSNLGLFLRKGHILFVHPHGTFKVKQREARAFAFAERLLIVCRIICWKLLRIFCNFDRKTHQLEQCSQKLWWTGCYEQL